MTIMTEHTSVLLNEALDLLKPKEGGIYLDATFGGGGHTRAILESAPGVQVIAVDQDPQAAQRAAELKKEFPDTFHFYDTNFRELDKVTEGPFDGIFFDLGVSSYHFDLAERGFSFRKDGPLDMRMNPREGLSAHDFLEKASEQELIEAVRNYGEEQQWRKVVKLIYAARGTHVLKSSLAFGELLEKELGRNPRVKIHPATKTFQGIRIAINEELTVIEEALPKAFDALAIGGVLAVISFHSLEDRMVKRFFRRMAGRPEDKFDHRPQMMRERYASLVKSKPFVPTQDEVKNNPRSRSAKLRALVKEKEITL